MHRATLLARFVGAFPSSPASKMTGCLPITGCRKNGLLAKREASSAEALFQSNSSPSTVAVRNVPETSHGRTESSRTDSDRDRLYSEHNRFPAPYDNEAWSEDEPGPKRGPLRTFRRQQAGRSDFLFRENDMTAKSKPTETTNTEQSAPQSNRETVESIVVAVILAFLFRTFVAEAFVIPTGSMAPTLMGNHKDVACEKCGFRYQGGASSENEDRVGEIGRAHV